MTLLAENPAAAGPSFDSVLPEPEPVWRRRLWPVAVLYSFCAIWAVFTSAHGWYVGDNRFEQYVNPARRLAKAFGVWDPTRALGAPREDVWPGTTIPGAVFRSLGMSPWAAERMFHVICLVTMALGVTALVRVFRPRIGVEHLVAGFYAGFGPFSATFLVPTNLYYMVALGPWLVVAMIRGLTGVRPWRWAAGFALLVAWAGNTDLPGLAYNAIVLVLTGLYLVLVERVVRWRDVMRWAAGAVGLAVLCSAWTLAKTLYARDLLNARLVDTELPSVSSLTSSASESLRGLGNWLSYFRDQGVLLKPQGLPFFTNALVVTATFAVPLVALFGLWRVRWRPRVMFASFALLSLAVVVSAFASPTASPIGAAILWTMEHVALLSSFRNTYKAGGGIAIGVGVLAGVAVARARDVMASSGRLRRRLPTIGAAVVLVGVSSPFWSGSLYQPNEQVRAVPAYWSDAFAYLDQLPPGGLTAVVPAITRASYRWGWVGDDIFDALLARPHAVSNGVLQSSTLGANALDAFTLATQREPYRPGVAGALARRLGITEVVIRNDLKWEDQDLPRPATYEGLRHDPDFELVAAFGPLGVTVVAPRDRSNAAILERTLHPVEIYRLRSPGSLLRTSTLPRIAAVGDSNAFTPLHEAGLLAAGQPLVLTGATADTDIESVLRDSGGVAVTDTGRRRLRRLVSYEPADSFTLGRQQEAGRAVRELFPEVPTAEGTVWFPDAVSADSLGTDVSGLAQWASPANAFDGDPNTYWGVNWALAKSTPGLSVEFRAPHAIDRVDLLALRSPDGVPSVKNATIVLSDGSEHRATFDDAGVAHVGFPSTVTGSLRVMLGSVDVRQGLVGLAEVSVPGVDLRPFVEPGTDLFGDRSAAPSLTSVMSAKPTVYSFQRATRTTYLAFPNTAASAYDEEHSIRRRFVVAHAGDYSVTGSLRVTGLTPDSVVKGLVGGPVTATATGSRATNSNGQPMQAIDGSLATSWISSRLVGDTLTVDVPRQRVQQVAVITEPEGTGAAVSVVTVHVGDVSYSVLTQPTSTCAPFTLADIAAQAARRKLEQRWAVRLPDETRNEPCYRIARVTLPEPVTADQVHVTIDAVDRRGNPFGTEARVNEVRISGPDHGERDNVVDGSRPVSRSCADIGLRTSTSPQAGSGATMPVSFHTTASALLAGTRIPFSTCSPVDLARGESYLDSGSEGLVDSVALVSADWPTPPPTSTGTDVGGAAPISFESNGRAVATVTVPDRATVVLAQSYDPLWMMSIDGGAPRASQAVDGVNGWPVPAGRHALTFQYRPEFGLSIAMFVTLFGVVLSIALLLPRRRAALDVAGAGVDLSDDHVEVVSLGRIGRALAVSVATLLGVALLGPWALLVGAVMLVVVMWSDEPAEVAGVAAPVLFAIAGLVSVLMLLVESNTFGLLYPKDRSLSHHFTVVASVFALQSTALLAVAARAAAPRSVRPLPRARFGVALHDGIRFLRRHWLAFGIVAGGVIVRVAVARSVGTSSGVDQLVRNIRLGSKYTSSIFTGPFAADLSPLAPTVRAMVAVRPALLAGGVFAVTVAIVVAWARRRAPSVPAWLVVSVCVVSPLSWGLGLAGQFAALLVVAAGCLIDRPSPRPLEVAAAGAALGAAVLARPDAVVVVFVVAFVALRNHRFRDAVVLLGVSLLTIAPWANNVWTQRGGPWLAGSARTMVVDDAAVGMERWTTWWIVLGIVAVAIVALERRRRAGGSADDGQHPAADR